MFSFPHLHWTKKSSPISPKTFNIPFSYFLFSRIHWVFIVSNAKMEEAGIYQPRGGCLSIWKVYENFYKLIPQKLLSIYLVDNSYDPIPKLKFINPDTI